MNDTSLTTDIVARAVALTRGGVHPAYLRSAMKRVARAVAKDPSERSRKALAALRLAHDLLTAGSGKDGGL